MDLQGMTDSELAGLMDEMRVETGRRNKNNPNYNASSIFKSRWVVALCLLLLGFFVLFLCC